MDFIRSLFQRRRRRAHNQTSSQLDTMIPIQTVPSSSSSSSSSSPTSSPLKRSKSSAIRPKNLTTVMIHVPATADHINIRSLFGDYDYCQTSQTLGRSKASVKELQTSELKGVRWWYDPVSRVIYIEGRSKAKIEKATAVFRERIVMQMDERGGETVLY